ncbi:GntR family transcriptional regulator [Planosporangium thailandense]|uniref:GntR family transcriptional regulator n=1 Tax=Planosporangium thailandense TaxID=765197 RepID=A0ABX0Y1F1_9ACTN|nr:GntR family transcriptional regulator [Planosporangium thailandense]NJC72181.1 GntR family transcriptional regulator [Planosporangium thailandense]
MKIQIDPASPVPPYEQVRSQIAALAREGRLAAGTRLPTVRQLAGDLGLAVNTVARTYRELEAAGLVETRGRHGTFVTHRASGVPAEAERLAARYAEETRRLGLDPEQALGLVRAAFGLSEPEITAGR